MSCAQICYILYFPVTRDYLDHSLLCGGTHCYFESFFICSPQFYLESVYFLPPLLLFLYVSLNLNSFFSSPCIPLCFFAVCTFSPSSSSLDLLFYLIAAYFLPSSSSVPTGIFYFETEFFSFLPFSALFWIWLLSSSLSCVPQCNSESDLLILLCSCS